MYLLTYLLTYTSPSVFAFVSMEIPTWGISVGNCVATLWSQHGWPESYRERTGWYDGMFHLYWGVHRPSSSAVYPH